MFNAINRNNNLDEIVFANRNKLYGAYALRRAYPKHINTSLLIALAGGILAAFGPLLINSKSETTTATTELSSTVVDLVQPPEFTIEVIPTLPQPRIHAIENSTDLTRFQIVNDQKVTEQTNTEKSGSTEISSEGKDLNPISITGNTSGSIVQVLAKSEESNTIIPEYVEEMPEFIGGYAALKNYLNSDINYPKLALEMNKEGKVVVSFVVDETGLIKDVALVKTLGFGCDEEALRVVSNMPRWKPGIQNGKNVSVRIRMPISFVLE